MSGLKWLFLLESYFNATTADNLYGWFQIKVFGSLPVTQVVSCVFFEAASLWCNNSFKISPINKMCVCKQTTRRTWKCLFCRKNFKNSPNPLQVNWDMVLEVQLLTPLGVPSISGLKKFANALVRNISFGCGILSQAGTKMIEIVRFIHCCVNLRFKQIVVQFKVYTNCCTKLRSV